MINCRGSRNSDECHCMCHGPNGEQVAKHVVACCYECPKCKLKISTYSWDHHEKTCGVPEEAE
jgi:hypothetical protein